MDVRPFGLGLSRKKRRTLLANIVNGVQVPEGPPHFY
jgi:hypothetical protein